jgi:hypothetical protein
MVAGAKALHTVAEVRAFLNERMKSIKLQNPEV